jgi:hypothetical protein
MIIMNTLENRRKQYSARVTRKKFCSFTIFKQRLGLQSVQKLMKQNLCLNPGYY